MIQKEIYNAMVQAMKDKNTEDKATYSLLYSQLKNKAIELRVDELADSDSISVIKKFVKTTTEEKDSFEKAGRAEVVAGLARAIALVSSYIPKQLDEAEIKAIIDTLEDKSMKAVMSYFKTNYQGSVDMGLVSKIARG